MPRLPRTPLYEVQNAQNNTRVTPIQRVSGEDAVGDALGKAGNAAFEIGSRLREAQITNEVAKAHNDLNLKLDAEYRQLEKDTGDPAALEAKWQERSKAILAETSGGMTSPMHRRLFDAQAAQLAEGYQIKTRDLTRKKQVQGAVADTYRLLDDLAETAADPEIDLEVLQRNTDNTLSLARKKYSLGILNEEQLAEIEVKAGDQLEIGTSMRNVATINRLLDTGYIDEARDRMASQKNDKGEEQNAFRLGILPEQRAKLDEVLKVKAQAADAFGQADTIVNGARDKDGNVDWGAALESAYAIKDPELRQAVENRITTMQSQKNTADRLKQQTVQDAGHEVLLAGKGISDIPADIYADADAGTKQFWRDYVYQQQQRAKAISTMDAQQRAAMKEYENIVVGRFKGMATRDEETYLRGPSAWQAVDPDLYQSFLSLDELAQRTILEDIDNRRSNGNNLTAVDKIDTQLQSTAERLIPEMAQWKKDNNEKYQAYVGAIRNAAEREANQLAGGGELTDARAKQIIATIGQDVTSTSGMLWWKKTNITYNDPEGVKDNITTEQRRHALDVATRIPSHYRVAREKLIEEGNKNPTEYEIAREAEQLKLLQDLMAGARFVGGLLGMNDAGQ